MTKEKCLSSLALLDKKQVYLSKELIDIICQKQDIHQQLLEVCELSEWERWHFEEQVINNHARIKTLLK